MRLQILLIVLFLAAPVIRGANILMFLTLVSRSIKNAFLPLAEELARRGHSATIVTLFPSETLPPGVKEILLPEVGRIFEEKSIRFVPGNEPETIFTLYSVFGIKRFLEFTCNSIFDLPEIQDIIHGKEIFDLALVNLMFEDCSLGIINKLDIPFVYVSSYGFPVEYSNNLRVPSCMPYCPFFNTYDYSNRMSFIERLKNSFTTVAATLCREGYFAPAIDSVIEKRLGIGLPSVLDIERNVSIIIINDHFSITYARPILPNVIQAACMHCRPAKPLPKEMEILIEAYVDEGIIYFSLGTVVPAHLMSEKLLNIFVKVFSQVKQTVIWKIDADSIPNLSSNVKLFKWLPQQDLLGHPKLKLFMSHAGLLSVQEAAYHGAPMLGFPTNIDQPYNMRAVEMSGTGLYMSWKNVTEETLLYAINEIITNEKYKKNVETRKRTTRDLQNPPLETAVYWIEYVLRHDGAPQLRTGGLQLTWHQYYQVDIAVFLLAMTFFLLTSSFLACRGLYRLICRPKKKRSKQD